MTRGSEVEIREYFTLWLEYLPDQTDPERSIRIEELLASATVSR